MRAKITHGGVTVELEDATAEDVERVLSAIGQRDIKPAFEPIKELAPVPTLPIDPRVGSPLPGYAWPSREREPFAVWCGGYTGGPATPKEALAQVDAYLRAAEQGITESLASRGVVLVTPPPKEICS